MDGGKLGDASTIAVTNSATDLFGRKELHTAVASTVATPTDVVKQFFLFNTQWIGIGNLYDNGISETIIAGTSISFEPSYVAISNPSGKADYRIFVYSSGADRASRDSGSSCRCLNKRFCNTVSYFWNTLFELPCQCWLYHLVVNPLIVFGYGIGYLTTINVGLINYGLMANVAVVAMFWFGASVASSKILSTITLHSKLRKWSKKKPRSNVLQSSAQWTMVDGCVFGPAHSAIHPGPPYNRCHSLQPPTNSSGHKLSVRNIYHLVSAPLSWMSWNSLLKT